MTDLEQFAMALDAATAQLGDSPAPARIVAGAPRCGELALVELPGLEIGIWEVTPGRFLSSKPDVGEVMHFVAGAGEITHADGTVTRIAPGVTLSLQPGWTGEWEVTATVRKVYAIYSGAKSAADAAS
jgi:uncharacterized cupin superfamily protein